MADNWYRNEIWTEEIERKFNERLKRSRGSYNKAEYLRIQATTLLYSDKKEIQEAGVILAERVFSDFAKDDKDAASSKIMMMQNLADYYMSVGEFSLAANYYLMIINGSFQQSEYSGNSDVALHYIDAVLKAKLIKQYQYALCVFNDFNPKNLLLPSEFFLAAKVGAFLHYELKNTNEASKFALKALKYTKDTKPKLKSYPDLGVPSASKEEIDLLLQIAEFSKSK